MADLGGAANALGREWSAAQGQWSETNSKWRDNKGVGFERRYWSTLERELSDFVDALNEIESNIRESQQRVPD